MRGLGHFIAFVLLLIVPISAAKAQGLSIIRDTEIEQTLKQWATPLLRQAGLAPDGVDIILVDSNEINAFVAGGANVFIYAGLIQKADYPEEVIGVIAHEIGHIEGGHLIETRRAMERASYQSILATIAGIGAAVATGEGGAASAISLGGSGAAQSGFFSHSRVQESAADQAALRYLNGAEMNPQGLVTFLQKLEGQELLPASQQSEYMRTHPLTRDRIAAMKQGAAQSRHASPLGNAEKQRQFDFIRAKLRAFREPHMVSRYYNSDSGQAIDTYAHAIMNYRQRNYDAALNQLDQLIAQEPQNAPFRELKAQVLRDAGRLAESETAYKQALDLYKTDAPLVQIALAHVMIEQQKYGEGVESLLLDALQHDKQEARTYRLLATLKGRTGREADAQYYLAEEAASMGRARESQRLVQLAMDSDALSSGLRYKAQDLKTYLGSLPERKN